MVEASGVMKNPPHPGALLREDVLEKQELTVTKAAKLLRISKTV